MAKKQSNNLESGATIIDSKGGKIEKTTDLLNLAITAITLVKAISDARKEKKAKKEQE
ncbi:MAG: hypothetical protein ACI38A_03935 [Candidatus Ornithomonoglobus sp.]